MDMLAMDASDSISISIPHTLAAELSSELSRQSELPDFPPCLSSLLGLILEKQPAFTQISTSGPTPQSEPETRNLGQQKQGESGVYKLIYQQYFF
jgi:hypothetical protein